MAQSYDLVLKGTTDEGHRLGRGDVLHLTLEAPQRYERLGVLAQMNPPVRDGVHRTAIWRALEQGIVDVLGSDHASHAREEKAKEYPATPSGMTGVQTLVPIMARGRGEFTAPRPRRGGCLYRRLLPAAAA
jgi:dihydroorotase-like cyclic amidohydrolase